MFDLDGIGPKIRALYNTFVGWTRSAASSALTSINTNLDAPLSTVSSGGKRRIVRLASGSAWPHPPNVKDNFVLVTLVAAGGAGSRQSASGAGGAGGGGGETLQAVPYFLTGSSTTVSVASATPGRTTNGAGNDGANTTFGSLIARGGKGGGYNASPATDNAGGTGGGSQSLAWRFNGGDGGNGDGTDVGGSGQAGSHSLSNGGAASGQSGGGGASFGPGGAGGEAGGNAGSEGGGGGGCRTGTSGGGGAGFILIEYEEAA